MDKPEALDSEVLRRRGDGQAYARISRDLGLQTPMDAQKAFQRAFHGLPSVERGDVRRAENSRLDELAVKVKADTAVTAEDQARRLRSIERLRTLVTEP